MESSLNSEFTSAVDIVNGSSNALGLGARMGDATPRCAPLRASALASRECCPKCSARIADSRPRAEAHASASRFLSRCSHWRRTRRRARDRVPTLRPGVRAGRRGRRAERRGFDGLLRQRQSGGYAEPPLPLIARAVKSTGIVGRKVLLQIVHKKGRFPSFSLT